MNKVKKRITLLLPVKFSWLYRCVTNFVPFFHNNWRRIAALWRQKYYALMYTEAALVIA